MIDLDFEVEHYENCPEADMKCPECHKAAVEIVKGWESELALQCRKCGEYCYFVGGITCIKTAHFDDDSYAGWDIAKARAMLKV
jgi:hypothetical protein